MDYINGYALALFDVAKEEKKLQKYKDESLEIIAAINGNEDYLAILNKKSIAVDERKEMVEKAFGSLDKDLIHFLFILVEKAKVNLLPAILNKLIKFINESLKISEGVVYTPEKISPADIAKIETKIARELGLGKLSLVNKLDNELISGFRVVVKDEIIEDTMASRLEQIKQELLERKEK